MKKNTTFIENNAILSNTSNGVFVDIFPIEFLPNNPLKRKFFLKIADFLTKLINIISAYQFQTNKNILKSKTKLIGNLLSFWSFYKWHDIYTWFISHSNGDKYCTIPSGRKGVYGELQPVDVFFPLTEGLFEGIEVKLPQRYDSYLTSLYDDYMQLPPENKRDSGHYLVKFSLTEDRYTTP
jgi:lipopolysaccharide cholinephosphotransferase